MSTIVASHSNCVPDKEQKNKKSYFLVIGKEDSDKKSF